MDREDSGDAQAARGQRGGGGHRCSSAERGGHRSHRTDAPYDTGKQQIAMHIPYGDAASNKVELLAFLSAPGRLVIKQGSTVSTKDVAAAGMVSFTVTMVPGTTPAFELQRGGKIGQALQSKTPIRAKVTYQDMMYRAGGGTACGGKA